MKKRIMEMTAEEKGAVANLTLMRENLELRRQIEKLASQSVKQRIRHRLALKDDTEIQVQGDKILILEEKEPEKSEKPGKK